MATTGKAVIYARISLDRDLEEKGVNRQVNRCKELAKFHGLQVVDEFVDNDRSAYRDVGRPAYEDMIARLEQGDIDYVLVFHVDRLTRRIQTLIHLMEVLKRNHVKVLATDGSGLDPENADGMLVSTILGALAEHESAHKADRIKVAMEDKALRGENNVAGRRLFGYNLAGKSLEINAHEAEAVKWAAEFILSGGTLYAVAKEWNKRGYTSTLGNSWHPSSVRDYLLNPKIAGKSTWNPTVDDKRLRSNRRIVGKAKWEPILDETTWERLRLLITDPARRRNRGAGNKPKYLGSGIYKCVCGRPLYCGYRHKKDGTKERVYTCRVRREGRGGGLPHSARKADPLDTYIAEVILQRLERRDFVDYLTANSAPGSEVTLAELLRERDEVNERYMQLGEQFGNSDVSPKFIDTALKELDRRSERIDAQIEELAEKGDPFSAVADVPDFRRWWEGAPLDMRRALLDAMLEVTVEKAPPGLKGFHPQYIKLDWKV